MGWMGLHGLGVIAWVGAVQVMNRFEIFNV